MKNSLYIQLQGKNWFIVILTRAKISLEIGRRNYLDNFSLKWNLVHVPWSAYVNKTL